MMDCFAALGYAQATTDQSVQSWLDGPYMLGDWGGERTKLANMGIKFSFISVNDFLADTKGDEANWSRVRGTMDIDFGQLELVQGLTFHITALWQAGGNMGTYIGSIANPSSLVSADAMRLAFSNRRMSMKIGQGMRRPRSGRLPFFGFWFSERERWLWSRAVVGKWETCFWFSTFPWTRSRAVGMWESRAFCEISKGRWKAWETRSWFSTLSTGPAFPRPSVSGTSARTASGIAEAAWPWPRSSGERIRCR